MLKGIKHIAKLCDPYVEEPGAADHILIPGQMGSLGRVVK